MVPSITGPQKAAILLYTLGEELAAEIVKKLDEAEIEKIAQSMTKISTIAPETMEAILGEFQQLAGQSSFVAPLNISHKNIFLKNILTKTLSGEKAQNLLEKFKEEKRWNLFKKLNQLDPKALFNFIKNEHPQIIAVILVHLEPRQAAATLKEFPENMQSELLFRISQTENVSPNILEDIDRSLQKEFLQIENLERSKLGGLHSVAEILNQMDSTTEENILQHMEEFKPGLAEDIRKLLFIFEDLAEIDDRSMMAILKEVNNDTLKLALKTASDKLKEKIFKNMSERAVQMLKEDLEIMGPARLKDVESAQQEIIKIAKKLEAEGKVMLLNKGKEDVFV
ncbi:MAG: flagellar motor switch protein FliG [Thermodesulfobacteriota bacterium]